MGTGPTHWWTCSEMAQPQKEGTHSSHGRYSGALALVTREDCATEHHGKPSRSSHSFKTGRCNCFIWLLLFSHWVVSSPLLSHELQHTRLPCPLLSPEVCPNSCLLSQWYHPTVSSSVALFPSCPQSFPDQGLFQWVGSWLQVAKVLELQHQSFQWIFRVDFL